MVVRPERVIVPGFTIGKSEMVTIVLQDLRQEALPLSRRHRLVEQDVAERRCLGERRRDVRIARRQLLGDDARGQSIGAGSA